MADAKLWAGFIVAIIIVGVAAFYAGTAAAPVKTVTQTTTKLATTTVTTGAATVTVTKTVTAGQVSPTAPGPTTVTMTKTQTVTQTVTAAAPGVWTPPEKIKAAWIYVGPVGDFGWSFMHDYGRRVAATLFKDWLDTTFVESVSEAALKETIETLLTKGYNVIFTTSFEFMDGTLEEAKLHPEAMFFHCSGYKRYTNMATYFADLYQVYYLNGLMAGALTKTGNIGYVAAYTIPEVVRHINAFAIGAKEVGEQLGKDIKVYVIEIGSWFAPDKATEAARTLVEQYGVDVLAYTEDSTAIIEFAQKWTQEHPDHPVYVFSHYSPGYVYGPDAVVSGQLVRWEVIYVDILAKIKAGILTPYNLGEVDYWYLLNTGAVELGCHVNKDGTVMHVNPKFVPVLKGIKVKDKVTGEETNVYDLVMKRYYQMRSAPLEQPLQGQALTHKYENVVTLSLIERGETYRIAPFFDPFTGPLSGYMKDKPEEKVSIPAGTLLGHDDLWSMQWFVDWVKYLGAGG